MAKKGYKRWTDEENDLLIRQVKAFPHNLNKCFIMVGEMTNRSPKAVAAHWYKVISKDPNTEVVFGFLAPKSFSKNRKGGTGIPHTFNVFKRILKILGLGR